MTDTATLYTGPLAEVRAAFESLVLTRDQHMHRQRNDDSDDDDDFVIALEDRLDTCWQRWDAALIDVERRLMEVGS